MYDEDKPVICLKCLWWSYVNDCCSLSWKPDNDTECNEFRDQNEEPTWEPDELDVDWEEVKWEDDEDDSWDLDEEEEFLEEDE